MDLYENKWEKHPARMRNKPKPTFSEKFINKSRKVKLSKEEIAACGFEVGEDVKQCVENGELILSHPRSAYKGVSKRLYVSRHITISRDNLEQWGVKPETTVYSYVRNGTVVFTPYQMKKSAVYHIAIRTQTRKDIIYYMETLAKQMEAIQGTYEKLQAAMSDIITQEGPK